MKHLHFKKILSLLMALLMITVLTACSEKEADNKTDVQITMLAGPTGMGAVKLMSDNDAGKASNNYHFTIATTPDEVKAAIINGTTDIAAIPTNLAAVLYKKTEGAIKIAALNTLGVLYILENGNTINSVEDLRGKTIYATGQGSTPEYILRHLLTLHGIDPDNDVDIQFITAHAELASMMAEDRAVIGMLPEPNVTAVMSSSENVRVALDVSAEWSASTGGGSPVQGCVVVRTAFADEHPDAVKAFLKEYEASIQWVGENTDDAAVLIAGYGITAKEAIAQKALPNCNIKYVAGNAMKDLLNPFFDILYTANPASVGGEKPDEAIYYLP